MTSTISTPLVGLAKTMMPVPDAHPDVFDLEWPLRVADIDSGWRLRLDATARHLQDIGQDHLREADPEGVHPLWIVRRAMVDVIRPIRFGEMLRMRRWCSGTSDRWCEMRVRIDGSGGGLIESEACWTNFDLGTQRPSNISDDFMAVLRRTAKAEGLRWEPYVTSGSREDATEIRDYLVRYTDIDMFNHMNNAAYWAVVEDYLSGYPELLTAPLRVAIEHHAPVGLDDKLQIASHIHPAGSTDQFGPDLADCTVTTLTYLVGEETKAVAALFPL